MLPMLPHDEWLVILRIQSADFRALLYASSGCLRFCHDYFRCFADVDCRHAAAITPADDAAIRFSP